MKTNCLTLIIQGESENQSHSCVRLFAIPKTVACPTPLSMKFSSQEYWSGLPCPPPEDLLDLGIEPGSPVLQADSLPSKPPGAPKNSDPKNFDQFGM